MPRSKPFHFCLQMPRADVPGIQGGKKRRFWRGQGVQHPMGKAAQPAHIPWASGFFGSVTGVFSYLVVGFLRRCVKGFLRQGRGGGRV